MIQGHKELVYLGVAPYFQYWLSNVGQFQSMLTLVHELNLASIELL